MKLTLKKDATAIDFAMHSADGYIVEDEDLIAAANAAIALGKPLLLTGEPGIGKSEFAGWLAAQPEVCPLHKFVVKSTTEANELFYQFDTLARFRDAQIPGLGKGAEADATHSPSTPTPVVDMRVHRYLRYNALGEAILSSIGRQQATELGFISDQIGTHTYESIPAQATRSVVLIDEIDKAPRDVPNDILDEIDHQSFRVQELGNIEITADSQFRPIVIITSNSERDLPKPFLRRCIYYHMRLSTDNAVLKRIAEKRLGKRFEKNDSLLGESLRLFRYLHDDIALRHKPGLAELLDWLTDLALSKPVKGKSLSELPQAKTSLKNALLKNPDDQLSADRDWQQWLKHIEPGASTS